ncbi:MAG TPA: orotidine-5'-phosphate decarboxylase, partial [Spirochaetia bacterium]|nr:orotidine-5'-phosphate decarboxylase [Spirochaetia bacterium]
MNYNPVIIALDYTETEQALALVKKIGPAAGFYKIGPVLFLRSGKEIIAELKKKDKKIFLDLKFYDIPNTVEQAAFQAAKLEIDFFTIHLGGGRQMIESALRGIEQAGSSARRKTRCLGVSVLTSISPEILKNELNVNIGLSEYAGCLTGMAAACGI